MSSRSPESHFATSTKKQLFRKVSQNQNDFLRSNLFNQKLNTSRSNNVLRVPFAERTDAYGNINLTRLNVNEDSDDQMNNSCNLSDSNTCTISRNQKKNITASASQKALVEYYHKVQSSDRYNCTEHDSIQRIKNNYLPSSPLTKSNKDHVNHQPCDIQY